MQLNFGKIKCPRCGAGPRSLSVRGAWANVTCPSGHHWRHFARAESKADAEKANVEATA